MLSGNIDLRRATLRASRHGLGVIGELTAAKIFSEAGFSVMDRLHGYSVPCDLRIVDMQTGEFFDAEVKAARQTVDKKWRFTLFKKGHTNHCKSDIVVLLAYLKSGAFTLFLIPTSEVQNQSQCVITSHPDGYNGRLARWRYSLNSSMSIREAVLNVRSLSTTNL
jgi:hypothetical protein